MTSPRKKKKQSNGEKNEIKESRKEREKKRKIGIDGVKPRRERMAAFKMGLKSSRT